MNHEAMEAKVRALFDARATNNAAKLADFLADDVVFFVRGHWTSAISQYPVRGKRAYIEMLRLMIVQLENLGSTFHETMAQGDRFMVHRTTTVRHRGTSEIRSYDVFDIIRFRDDLIVEFSEYPDTVQHIDMKGV